MKRHFDVLLSSAALMLISPILLLIGLFIRWDSPGPIFYRQGRLGKKGLPFQMYKFRTMVQGAESMPLGLFNYRDDPRVTRVGKFLRRTSLDEVPQLINVLKGEMSIVGPRPPVTYELGDYESLNAKYKNRFQVLPGITGLAQVEGRNNLGWEQKVELDNIYIDLFLVKGIAIDISILLMTIARVFEKKNIFEEKDDPLLSDEDAAMKAAADVIAKAHAPTTGMDHTIYPKQKREHESSGYKE